ncbi:MAG: rod shape-determining protein MreC [Muribaculaceae bacterium]|nr:rod shape-determining protein MreC [Muribaculaceae bacterium]
MKNLLDFFIKHSTWFVFTFYAIVSLLMLFQSNPYQQSVYLSSANAVSATVYNAVASVTSYLNLRDINEDLQERNALLEMEVTNLRNQIYDLKLQLEDSAIVSNGEQQFDFILAHVISNSISQANNYITINRGSAEGIEPEMGVVDQNGVVGMVNVVGKHSARIISLLNPNMRLSCKLKNSEYFGSLVWDGKSPEYAILQELPKHVLYHKGDTIVTSGYSSVFPEGIIVGIVKDNENGLNENFISLKVKLTTNFSQLSTVRALRNTMREELDKLEAGSQPEGKEDTK